MKTFAELAREIARQDVAKADKLRRARSLPKPKSGPRVAR